MDSYDTSRFNTDFYLVLYDDFIMMFTVVAVFMYLLAITAMMDEQEWTKYAICICVISLVIKFALEVHACQS